MGLRLYQAPVKSDIQCKPASEKRSAQTRSSIRRRQWRDIHGASRDVTRRHMLQAAAAAASREPFLPVGLRSHNTYRRSSPPADAAATSSTSSANADADGDGSAAGPENGRRALRNMASRLGILDDSMLAIFGERWAHLHAESNPSTARSDDHDAPLLSNTAVEPDFLPARRVRVTTLAEPYATSSIRSTQEPGRSSSRVLWYSRRMRPDDLDSPHPASRSRDRSSFESAPASEPRAFDGLGDRNRSLSPEGDQHWNTLLTTITPDPQPPSLGSSFASASALASAAASQDAGTNSSRTSFAGPDMADDSVFEPPCESGCEGSETEGDEEDDENPLDRFPSDIRAGRRSYADVTRSSQSSTREQSLEMFGGFDGMQRIVSNLARREDIPDEWWAEAGLSRTLSRETSN